MNTINLKYLLLILAITMINACNTQKKMGPNETKFKNILTTIGKHKEISLHYVNGSALMTNGNIEVLINDMPAIQNYTGIGETYRDINQYILQSGMQKIEMKYFANKNYPYRKDFDGDIYIYIK